MQLWDVVETYHSDVIGCIIWEFQETFYGRTNGMSWIRITGTSWWRTTETSLGVSFGTCLRRHGDLLMRRRHDVPLRRSHGIIIRRRGDVPLRRFGNVPLRHRWVFHLRCTCDVAGMYRETSLRRCHDVLLPGGTEESLNLYWMCSYVFMSINFNDTNN